MDESVRECLTADGELRRSLDTLIRYGSYERGDFRPGHGDLDFFAVFDTDPPADVLERLEEVLRESTSEIDHRGIDLAWEHETNLGQPDAGVRFKFLYVYQFDFRRHHTVVLGDFPTIPRREFREALPGRLDRIDQLVTDAGDEGLRILAGEVARLRALCAGADSLRKQDVAETLTDTEHSKARRVYEAYLEDEVAPYTTEELRRFVSRETEALRSDVNG
ncbi:nucleotidyltransferase domain-containing protein [Halobaculum sp. MBLA0147]|uniref:nucleotidyltransferase domain-containing protein n=1 Tax=Halobaculum sp. MBLA0147 TaxID=3079934 RepID=UPI003524958F